MDKKSSWTVLFTPTPPKGVDLDAAASSLKGEGELDPAIKLEKTIADRVEEFLSDPAGFISKNSTDTRMPQWTTLAQALGVKLDASVSMSGTPPTTPSASTKKPKLTTAGLMGARIGPTRHSAPSVPKSAPSIETPTPGPSTTVPTPEPETSSFSTLPRTEEVHFKLTAEQRRLDEEIEKKRRETDLKLESERRKLDDEAEARRIDREHRAEELKLEREDKAAKLKLEREEAAAIRRCEREEEEEKKKRLEPPVLTRPVLERSDKLPPIVRWIVTSEPYTQGKNRIMPILEKAVSGDAFAEASLEVIKTDLRKIERTGTGYMVAMSARHLLKLIDAYMEEKGKPTPPLDPFTIPSFKARYETGIDP